jgi:hypothetical protein
MDGKTFYGYFLSIETEKGVFFVTMQYICQYLRSRDSLHVRLLGFELPWWKWPSAGARRYSPPHTAIFLPL